MMNPLSVLLFIFITLSSHVGQASEMKLSDLSYSDNIFSSEVLVKSLLSDNSEKVYVDITLPKLADVGFEIYDAQQKIQHLWHDQSLDQGRHQLSLTLPQLEKGKYLLHIKVGDETFKHLVIL